MASIRERDGRFNVQIRIKNFEDQATFTKREDAELWAAYKEDMANKISNFKPPVEELITIEDAIRLKLEEFDPKSRNYNDYEYLLTIFGHISGEPISYLTYENMQEEWERLTQTTVQKGGKRGDASSGRHKLPAPVTIMKKFILLNGVVNNLIQKKLSIVNNIQPFITHLRKTIKES